MSTRYLLPIPFLDALLKNESLEPGKVYLHLSVTGGGKSTAAFQVLDYHARTARRAEKVALLYTEPTHSDYHLWSCMSSIKREYFIYRNRDLSDQEHMRLESAARLFYERVKYLTFDDKRPIESLEEQLQSEVYKGIDLKLVVVDSLNSLCDCQSRVSGHYRHRALQANLLRMQKLARKLDFPIWATHHLNTKQHRVDLPDVLAADGFNKLALCCDAAIVSGRLSNVNVATFQCVQGGSKSNANDVRFGHLRNDMARWEITENDWYVSPKGITKSDKPLMRQTYKTHAWDSEEEGFVE